MANNYVMEGRQIFSDKGKLVATLNEDGNPVMAPGMAGPHSRGVKEFLEEMTEEEYATDHVEETDGCGSSADDAVEDNRTGTESREDWEISTIPEENLPPFSKELGCNTPGFMEYVGKYKLTKPQVAALVKRMSK